MAKGTLKAKAKSSLPFIPTKRKSGKEKLLHSSHLRSLLNFWQWAYSDLLGNTEREQLAKYLVAVACGVDHLDRVSWNYVDLVIQNGLKVEVKSSAYIQTWNQVQYSGPRFNIQKTLAWDPVSGKYGTVKKRHSDLYVFALLVHKDQSTLNPLDVSQWTFFVISRNIIDEQLGDAKSVSLSKLITLKFLESKFSELQRFLMNNPAVNIGELTS